MSNAGDAEKTENHCGYREFSHRLLLYTYPLEGQKTCAKASGKWSNLYDYKSSGFHLFVVTQYLLRCCHILCGVRAPVFYEIVAISVCQIKAFHIRILQNEKVFLQAVKISDSDRYMGYTSHGHKNKMTVKSFNRSYKYHLSVGVFIASSWALTPALFFSSSQRIRNLWS